MSPAPPTNSINTLGFWFWSTNSSTNLTVRLFNSPAISTLVNVNISFTPANYVPPMLVSPATNSLSPGVANQLTTNFPAFPPLWINELQAENLSGITDNAGERDPWVEICNTSTNTVALNGLYLSSGYTNLTQWAFPAGASIGPTQFLVVFCDGQAAQTSGAEYHTSFRLSANSGAIALSRLYTNAPQVLDYVNYAGVQSDRSYGSFPDGQPFERQEFFHVTPRGTNDGRSAPLLVLINEWMASNSGTVADPADAAFDDWFELYNPTANAANLTGYFLTNTLTNKFKYEIPPGYLIPPFGRLLVWADNETGQNATNRVDLHANFQLAAGGEAIGLFAADGTQVDAVTFGPQTNNISQGRCPDGATNIIFMTIPTPRLANQGCGGNNTAPVLAPIGNRVVYFGETLSFSASATDADAPPQLLTFSLDAGAPEGAVMNPDTGLFTWMPAQSQTPSTNNITVRVRDDGVPPLDDFETIAVIVSLPPGFTSARRNGNNFEMMWRTYPGKTYRVEYADELEQPTTWLPLGNDLPASGNTLSVTNSMGVLQRFYRIRVVD